MSQDLKNRTDLLIQSNMTMPSLKGTGHKASNSMTAMPGKAGLNPSDKNQASGIPQSEKIKGLNQAFQNLQNSTIPQKTLPVGNIIQQSLSGGENPILAKKKGSLANKNLQHQQANFA